MTLKKGRFIKLCNSNISMEDNPADQARPTKRFITGAVLIALSLILGKLVLVPMILFPVDEVWRMSMLIIYVFSWIILMIGIYLCGMEGYRFVKNVYHAYQQKTITKVKHHSKRAAQKTVQAIKSKMQKKKAVEENKAIDKSG